MRSYSRDLLVDLLLRLGVLHKLPEEPGRRRSTSWQRYRAPQEKGSGRLWEFKGLVDLLPRLKIGY